MNGKQIRAAATAVCILLTITALTLAAIEVVSFLVLARASSETPTRALQVYDRSQTWPATFWREYDQSRQFQYHPYVVWRRAPFAGETITVGSDGLRNTAHSTCEPDTYLIYMFGGSTLWGTGAPDWGTIPSLLAEEYKRAGRTLCIRNFGETAWVSTQEVVALMVELKRAERKPDLVVFYDGINDVFSAWQSGRADVHQNFARIKAQFEDRGGATGTFKYLLQTNTAQWLLRMAARRPNEGRSRLSPENTQELAQATAASYLKNVKLVAALSKEHGFAYAFFWQPVLLAGGKPLTAFEEEVRTSRNKAWPGAQDLYEATYKLVGAERQPRLFDIADVFADYTGSLYLDFAHIIPEGNRLVSRRMYETLGPLNR